jgi:hypothetical protein
MLPMLPIVPFNGEFARHKEAAGPRRAQSADFRRLRDVKVPTKLDKFGEFAANLLPPKFVEGRDSWHLRLQEAKRRSLYFTART